MDVRLPDGTVIRDVPEGTTQTELMERVGKMRAGPSGTPPTSSNPALTALTGAIGVPMALGETALALGTGTLATPLAGLHGIASMAMGGDAQKDIQETQQALTYEPRTEGGKSLLGAISYPFKKWNEAGEWMAEQTDNPDAASMVKTTMDLAPWLIGMSKPMQRVSDALLNAGQAATEKAKGAGRTMTQGTANLTDMVRKGGAERILTRYQTDITGKPNLPIVIDKLKAASELIPGSTPTASQALVGLPEGSPLIAHQKITAETKGGISADFGKRVLQQEAARKAALAPIAKTPANLEAAITARAENAATNYGAAYNVILDAKLPKSLATNPYIEKAIPGAIELAKANKIDPKTNLTQFLHYVKVGLDEQLLPQAGTALSNTRKAAIVQAKDSLLAWMAKKNPQYDKARAAFATESQPINAMQVGQALESKLTTPMGTESPGTFLRAVDQESKLIKNATGMPRQAFTPEQRKVVDALSADLERDLAAKRPVQPTNLQGGLNVAEEVRPHAPQMLSRPMMLANAVLRRLGRDIEPQIDAAAARRYLTPSLLAKALESVPAPQRSYVMNALLKQAAPYALAGSMGRSLE